MSKKILLSVLLAITLITNLKAQEPVVSNGNVNTWFLLMNRFYLTDKFTISNEFHERTGDFFADQATFIFRPSVDYAVNDNVELSVGYSYVRSWPYEPYTLAIPTNEHNIWEQALLKFETAGVQIQNRIRFEHRWVDNVEQIPLTNDYVTNGSDFSNRFRFRLTVSFDLIKIKDGHQSIFFNAFDEAWINQSDNLMPTNFTRNWIYTGIGYKFNPEFNIQLAHMHQYDNVAPNTYISSSIIQLSVFKNFDLRRFQN